MRQIEETGPRFENAFLELFHLTLDPREWRSLDSFPSCIGYVHIQAIDAHFLQSSLFNFLDAMNEKSGHLQLIHFSCGEFRNSAAMRCFHVWQAKCGTVLFAARMTQSTASLASIRQFAKMNSFEALEQTYRIAERCSSLRLPHSMSREWGCFEKWSYVHVHVVFPGWMDSISSEKWAWRSAEH